MAVLVVAALCGLLVALSHARPQGGSEDDLWWSGDLVAALEEEGWEPPYFEGTVRTFPEDHHLRLAREATAETPATITVGDVVYRTSPARIAAGREIFRNYHFGTHLYWDFRRAIDNSTGITEPETYGARYGVKRDRDGFFVGLIGVEGSDGRVRYGHSCALCHSNVTDSGEVVDGMANHDYDIGLYYDALRPRVRDGEMIFLGDAPLELLRHSGPGRTDSTIDSHWAPMRVPHLFALRAFDRGVRANGDMSNLWIQCYRNLNGSYAVDSEIMESLMAYLLSLEPPPNPRPRGDQERRGEAIFRAQRCHRCHAPPYFSNGMVIDWEVIRTDPERIRNGFPKGYKVASLLRLDRYRFYFHDGALTSLEQLFDPGRLDPSFQAPGIPPGRRKPGTGVPGHEFGLRLPPSDRSALIAYLESL